MTLAQALLASVVLVTGTLVWVCLVVFVCSMFSRSLVLEPADAPRSPESGVGRLEDETNDDDEEDERPLAPVIPINPARAEA